MSPDRPPIASSNETVSSNPSLPTIIFDHAEFLAFFHEGIERAQYARQGADAEKASLRRSFQASISRANRRAHKTQEKLRWQRHKSGEKLKARDRELNQKLKTCARDHVKKKLMRKDFEKKIKRISETQVKIIRALQRENETLRREFKHQRRQIE